MPKDRVTRRLAREAEADLTGFSFKRLAWAYGCAPRGSTEERALERLLRERILGEASGDRSTPADMARRDAKNMKGNS